MEINLKCIIYWRIPKTGSTTIIDLISNNENLKKKIKFIQLGHDECSFDIAEKQINRIINKYGLKKNEYIVLSSIRIPSKHALSLYSHGGNGESMGFKEIIKIYDIKNYEDYLNKLFNNDIILFNKNFGNYKYYYYKLENMKNIENLHIIRTENLVGELNYILKKYVDKSIQLKDVNLNKYNMFHNLTKTKENKKERQINSEQIKIISDKYFKEIDNLYELFITDFINNNLLQ